MKYRLNLLSAKKKSLVDRSIYFTLYYLRYILVITQIVVIGVFFYRFQIDQEIVDLKEVVQQKQEIVFVSNPLVKEAQAIDSKVGVLDSLIKEQGKFTASLDYLFNRFPEKVKLDSLIINSDGSFNFNGQCTDVNIIRLFYMRLLKEAKFKNIELTTLEKKTNGFNFSIKLSAYQ